MSPAPTHRPAVRMVSPGSFHEVDHFYPRVLNAQLHPLVRFFQSLGNHRIAERYCHLHPEADRDAVRAALSRRLRWFRWGGTDLFHTTTPRGERRIVVIETNSSPSGQKSFPRADEVSEQGGFAKLVAQTLLPSLARRGVPQGGLAVLYDKNEMEASGYAAALADAAGEPVLLVPFFDGDPDPSARFSDDRVLEVRGPDGAWAPIRGALRYVTQRPWNRIPPITRTVLLNPVLICLAGGRNKLLAAKAYDLHNATLRASGLRIRVPETIWDVGLGEVPLWVERMGGYAVVKNPYSNAGQGVWTLTSPEELAAFQALDHPYDRFIVQALIGNAGWSSQGRDGRLYHVGTMPDRKGDIHVADVRFMVASGDAGFYPVAIYARRSKDPLAARLEPGMASWDMLGTNLSVKQGDGTWTTETERLLLMDHRDFNRLGLGLDDLIEGYLQTVLSMTAIDEMAARLVNSKGRFRRRMFRTMNPDDALVAELAPESK